MDWKEFFWATKEKTVLTIGLFVLLNVLFFPTDIQCKQGYEPPICNEGTEFSPLWEKLNPPLQARPYTGEIQSIGISYEIMYLGFSFLVSCIVFHLLKKRGKNGN